jgi:hypothetical protein
MLIVKEEGLDVIAGYKVKGCRGQPAICTRHARAPVCSDLGNGHTMYMYMYMYMYVPCTVYVYHVPVYRTVPYRGTVTHYNIDDLLPHVIHRYHYGLMQNATLLFAH